ncbi:unnamed protein product [Closterium sp. NIES-53]
MVLPEGIGGLKELEVVKFARMNSLNRLPAALLELPRLRVLEVRGCGGLLAVLGDECTSGGSLASSISSSSSSALLPSLQRLKIRSENVKSFGPSLGRLSSLTQLKLLGMNRLDSLPDSISDLSRLQRLKVDSSFILKALPETLGRLAGLRVGISTIPDDFWKLASLQKLLIMGLKLVRRLPDSFTQLPKLEELEVSACQQLTRLPSCLGKMAMLRVCNISDCPLLSQQDMRWVSARRGEEDGEEGDGEGRGRGDAEEEEGGGGDHAEVGMEEGEEAWEEEEIGSWDHDDIEHEYRHDSDNDIDFVGGLAELLDID